MSYWLHCSKKKLHIHYLPAYLCIRCIFVSKYHRIWFFLRSSATLSPANTNTINTRQPVTKMRFDKPKLKQNMRRWGKLNMKMSGFQQRRSIIIRNPTPETDLRWEAINWKPLQSQKFGKLKHRFKVLSTLDEELDALDDYICSQIEGIWWGSYSTGNPAMSRPPLPIGFWFVGLIGCFGRLLWVERLAQTAYLFSLLVFFFRVCLVFA